MAEVVWATKKPLLLPPRPPMLSKQ
ncbi:unnamed protein product [Gulo gulo]|uniref:Uncharacterized protein n=1 Tax=Gulo gulo TaxID=48420 RepID=A0A9X9LGG9_GULGU|nr:unnamed protein product [Gulo gulo]